VTDARRLDEGGQHFAQRLLAWFERAGRHDLPWQRDRSLYRVWISEVMLQQTQVLTVIPYFDRFMTRFPTVEALAAAEPDEVLHLWSGLGYYARARNLHKAAKQVVAERNGIFPQDIEALNSLPGIGRSTAAAILAQALDQRHPILDGNVKRVMARWAGVDGSPGLPAVEARLWQISESLTPVDRAADYTQAIMDLGATVCTRTRPACDRCPVQAGCVALRDNRQSELPTPRAKRARPVRLVHWLIIENARAVVLGRRPPEGIWGGLYGFPEAADEAGIRALARARIGAQRLRLRALSPLVHQFTHFELRIQPWVCDGAQVVVGPTETWYNLDRAATLGIAAPVALLMAHLREF